MHVAAALLTIHIPASQSLKDRRRVLRSLLERTRNRFPVAAAEVGGQDTWQYAEIGLSAVSSSANHARQVIDEAVRFVEEYSQEAIASQVEADVMDF